MTRLASVFIAALFAALFIAPTASADPESGTWTGTACVRGNMNSTNWECFYDFTDATNSQTIVLSLGPWEICLDPHTGNDTAPSNAQVEFRKAGATATTNDSSPVAGTNGVTLDGDASAGTACIYLIGKGTYWVEVTASASGDPARVTVRKM